MSCEDDDEDDTEPNACWTCYAPLDGADTSKLVIVSLGVYCEECEESYERR
jgi:hypothetical protein